MSENCMENCGELHEILHKGLFDFHRRDILEKLQDLLTEMQESEQIDNQANEDSMKIHSNNNDNPCEDEKDKENNPSIDRFLQNPKKRKAKRTPEKF
jgi:hypothetical protein